MGRSCLAPAQLCLPALSLFVWCASSTNAAAENWYLRADVGATLDGAADIESPGAIGGKASLDAAALASLGLGYGFSEDWRVEMALAWSKSDLDAASMLDAGGSATSSALMANAYRDFPLAGASLYIGAGAGVALTEIEGEFTPPLNPLSIDDSDITFAYQLMAGVAVPLGSQAKLDIGYRYFVTPGFKDAARTAIGETFPVTADVSRHIVTAGLRWDF